MDLHIYELTNTLKSVRSARIPGAPAPDAADGTSLALCMCANRAGAPASGVRVTLDVRAPAHRLAHFAALGR